MSVTVRIPTTLRPLSGGASTVQVEGSNLAEVLRGLNSAHPGFSDRLFDAEGNLHKFVNIFVADDDVRYMQGLETKISNGQTVSIIPAVAGG
ncbi:MAG: MoaD/ThiS family protein [Actinomycetota bacterium]|jgi:molybdopterin synthase sulfur carrier subunit|nr:MoaD/ThiS family protein [Actinomycetota bacterium]